jgi:rhamnose utilization protein RhaD (predicted bifunctional aldolase and dehydrogenase)
MENDGLAKLKAHSVFVGSDPDLVQASGGNTSWKEDKKVWVKGSGKRLKDALTEDVFAFIDFETLTKDEILACQDFSGLVKNSISPSIEANFHLALSCEFITHLHSLGSIAIGISDRNSMELDFAMDISFVPYARPGVDLARAIDKIEDCSEKILVLRNHGVIVSGKTCSDIENKILEFESLVRSFFTKIPESESFPSWVEILTLGVLTPDEAVFLGEKPFVESEGVSESSVAINSKGELIFRDNFSNDRVELAKFYVRVAKLIGNKTQVNYLDANEVNQLLGWDKEKRRIAMSK